MSAAAPTRPAVELRPLELSDLPAVARIHRDAFPGSALTALGPEAVRRYYEWQLTGPHDGLPLGAFEGERMVGFCFGGVFRGALSLFVRRQWRYLGWRALMVFPRLAGPNFRRALAMLPRLFRQGRRLAAPPAPSAPEPPRPVSFGILAIAVDPAARGSGAARALMEASEAEARRRGFAWMHLSVRPDNARAVRFYEKLGWERHLPPGQEAWTGQMYKALAPAASASN